MLEEVYEPGKTEFHNPFDRGYLLNCADSFFRPCIMSVGMTSKIPRIVGSDGYHSEALVCIHTRYTCLALSRPVLHL